MNSPLWPAVLDLPENRDAQPAWLDRMLLSPDLADSVRALQQIHQRSPQDADTLPFVEQVLGSELDRFLTTGFAALSTETVAVLLQNPELLLELQELALLCDNHHWNSVLQPDAVKTRLQESVSVLPGTPGLAAQTAAGAVASPRPLRRLLSLTATLAAVALGAVLLWQAGPRGWQDPQGISGTGLGTPALFKQDTADADRYLQRMATAVEQLLQKSDLTQQSQLVVVLQNTIKDCEIAISQPHPVLAQRTLSNGETAETMFRRKCQNWQNDLSRILTDLQQGKIDVPTAGSTTTQVLQKLINRLRHPDGAEELV